MHGFTQEALQLLLDTQKAACQPTTFNIPGDPVNNFIAIGTEIETHKVPTNYRNHQVSSLPSFVAAVKRWGSEGVVYHQNAPGDRSRMILVIDDGDELNSRQNHVYCCLQQTRQFATLVGLGKPLNHKAFVDLLRHNLVGVVDSTLLPKVRTIETQSAGRVAAEVQHDKDRGVREFTEELAGAQDIPEYITCNVKIYSNGLNQSYTVECSLSFTLQPSLTFTLKPLPDEIDMAVLAAHNDLHRHLVDECPKTTGVFQGCP